jgi:A/G-specific adenine glycosylase
MDAHVSLLRWYWPRREAYPWRVRPEPYRVLVSEVMLQQTQASRVVSAYLRFLKRFPTVAALARAPRAEVIRAWRGLGYNRRAVALSEAARAIVRDHAGYVPSDPGDLSRLPGVGSYTAAAVASLAYGKPVPAVDANVRRIAARAELGVEPHEVYARRIQEIASEWLDRRDPAGWNQALMDLGREVCRPRPRCSVCPLRDGCRFRERGRSPEQRGARQERFAGSFRQLRGRVLDLLRDGPCTLASLSEAVGQPKARVAEAVGALSADGLVRASDGGLNGQAGGRVALHE